MNIIKPSNDSPLHVVGLGVNQIAELSISARTAIGSAKVIIGSERQLATLEQLVDLKQYECILLPKLSNLKALLDEHQRQSVVMLASGDPLYYGIGRWLIQQFERERLQFHPCVSSIQATCHRLGVSLQDADVLSLHGRPVESIRPSLRLHRQLLVLTDRFSQPQRLAQECIAAGFEQSELTVCADLGYDKESLQTFDVKSLARSTQIFSALHVTHIKVMGCGGVQPEFPGIPDIHFKTGTVAGKGMISKREVRLCILSLMQAQVNDIIWDVGAGCGGVSVELALWQPKATIYAIEYHQQRLMYLRENQKHFGVVNNLHVIDGRAPEALEPLPLPTKVFIGGSGGGLFVLIEQVWQSLPHHGILVVSGVTDSTKQQLQQFAITLSAQQVECVELSVKRGVASCEGMRYTAKLPVEIFKFTKVVGEV